MLILERNFKAKKDYKTKTDGSQRRKKSKGENQYNEYITI